MNSLMMLSLLMLSSCALAADDVDGAPAGAFVMEHDTERCHFDSRLSDDALPPANDNRVTTSPCNRLYHYAKASSLTGSFLYQYIAYLIIATVVSVFHAYNVMTLWYPSPFITAVQFVVSFLLVFRTNTAYERFWEGRKIWTVLMTAARNMHRVCVADLGPETGLHGKIDTLLVDHLCSIKDFLRFESIPANRIMENALGKFVNPTCTARPVLEHEARPHRLLAQLAAFIHEQRVTNTMGFMQLSYLNQQLSALTDGFGQAQRILRTPIPTAYSIHLRQIVGLYCIAFPFSIVQANGWSTVPLSALVYYVILGVQAVADEIENPFGNDYGDLPLEHFCETIERECKLYRQ